MFARQAERGRAPNAVRGGIARDERSVLFGGARRRRMAQWMTFVVVLVAVAGGKVALAKAGTAEAQIGPAPAPPADDGYGTPDVLPPDIEWRRSKALGLPYSGGALVRGVQLPSEGRDWFTYDFPLDRVPNRGWRRWGTDAILRTTFSVLRQYRAADPTAPRVGIADISRPRGGPFGVRFGGLGHASHQNGLDIDVLYPRRDEREWRAPVPALVDRDRAQALVDGFVEAGAEKVFVGPRIGLEGPRKVVVPLVHHDDHLHVRILPPP
jgi:murein endopeptidase